MGGVWDDSDTGDAVGGRCLNSWQASRRLKAGQGAYEEVVVQLSFDEHISGTLLKTFNTDMCAANSLRFASKHSCHTV